MDMGIGIHVYGIPSHVHGGMWVHELKRLGVARRNNSYPQVQWGMTTWVQVSSVHDTKYHEQCGDKRLHKAKQSKYSGYGGSIEVFYFILKSSGSIVWPTIIYSSGLKLAWPSVVFVDCEVVISYLVDFQRDGPSSILPRSRGVNENVTLTNLWLMYLKWGFFRLTRVFWCLIWDHFM